MEWVEITGKTLEEAKDEALDQLGIGADDAEFEILEEPRSGLFGLRRGTARIRARVRPAAVRPKQDRRQRRRDGAGRRPGEGGTTGGGESGGDAPVDASGDAQPTDRAESGGDDARAPRNDRRGGRRGGRGGGGGGGGERSGGGGDRSGRRQPRGEYGAASRGADVDDNMTDDREPVDVAEVQAAAETFARGLLTAFGIEGSATTTVDDQDIELRLDAADSGNEGVGLLIGPGGRTLTAVQELARVAAQRRLGDHQTRLRVDVAGYRERRREALEKFAQHVADLVKESGVGRSLDPMPAPDRKVIHDALAAIGGVSSRSEGEDPNRRIVVSPLESSSGASVVTDDADAEGDPEVEASDDE